ncbi:MAG: flagellar biosynthetic protein FliO [Spirochaetota bacterium]|jgi:flagellar protein FliO/FliZ|nr:flagellar biosynthetic protein FliO [Spirochaetota bacterium]
MRSFFVSLLLALSVVFAYAAGEPGQETNQADSVIGISGINRGMQELEGGDTRAEFTAPGGLGTFIETIVILSIFILGLYMLFRFLKRKRDFGIGNGETVRVLARQSLGGSKTVEVVEVGRRVFVLGAADAAVSLIAEISDEETLESLRLDFSREGSANTESFMDRLIRGLGRTRAEGSITREKLDYLRAQKERLTAFKKKQ